MNIIPSDIINVVLYENDHKALCALCCENQQLEDIQPIEYSSKKLKSLFEAYVVFDKLADSVIDSYNVEIEDFKTIAYVRLCNMKDPNGDNKELCHYFPETIPNPDPLWKKLIKRLIKEKKIISIIGIILITSVLILLNIDKIDEFLHLSSDDSQKAELITENDSTEVSKIDSVGELVVFENHLTTNGYLCYNAIDNVKLKMYVSPNVNADNSLIDWENVETYLTSKDTIYPKANCSIFIRAYYNDSKDSKTEDYGFHFNIGEFVRHVLLTIKDDEPISDIATDFLSDLGKKSFKFDNGLEPTKDINSLDDIRYLVRDFIKENPNQFKIDSVGFNKYKSSRSNKVIFERQYPSINYIRIK